MTARSHDAPLDDSDQEILDGLRAALEAADPMPPDLDDRVRFSLTVQALRAEIAELEHVPPDLAGVRSVDYTRVQTVTFTSELLSVVVTTTYVDSETSRVDGWIEGPAEEVELRSRQRTETVPVDDGGRFAFPRVERGLVQFVFRPSAGGDAKPVITPSMEI